MAESEEPRDISKALTPRRKRVSTAVSKSRLSVMPLAVLLPRLGDVSSLHVVAERIERRLIALQTQSAKLTDSSSEEKNGKAVEESMLNQVMQWLSVGEAEE